MSGFECTRFEVTAEEVDGRWRVDVCDGSEAYARVEAPDLGVALRMAVPYMAQVANPDPFRMLVRAWDR